MKVKESLSFAGRSYFKFAFTEMRFLSEEQVGCHPEHAHTRNYKQKNSTTTATNLRKLKD